MPVPLADFGCVAYNSRIYCIGYGNVLIYDDRTFEISNPSPAAGFINETVANTFTWELTSSPATTQASAVFQWRAKGAVAINTINVAAVSSVTVTAGTFPNGDIEWRVMAAGANGAVSGWTEWMELTTIDQTHNAPTNLYPSSGKRNGTAPIQLTWLVNSPLATPQSAFEIQVTYNEGNTWSAFSGKVITDEPSYVTTSNQFTPSFSGKAGLRVRTYNSDNVVGPWSQTAYFIVLSAPDPPQWVSVETGKSRPTAQWVASAQIGWQLQVMRGETVLYDTGEHYGTETSHKIQEYLPNAQYSFRLRILNELNLWSEWAARIVPVSAHCRLNPIIYGEAIANGASLSWITEVEV